MPLPNIRWISGSPVEKVEEGLEQTEGGRTLQGPGPWSQVTRTHGESQRTETLCGSDLGPLHLCYGRVAWCSCEIPNSGSKGSL